MIPCNERGPSAGCYALPDGTHLDSERRGCFNSRNPDCPVHGR